MRIGGKRSWKYKYGVWKEITITPDKWKFEFSSVKTRSHDAPNGTGALDNITIPYSVFLKMSLRT